MVDPRWGVLDEAVGEPLGDLGREKRGVGVGQGIELPMQRGGHVRMAMAEAGDGCAAGGVEVTAAVRIEDLEAQTRNGDRKLWFCQNTMQNMGHELIRSVGSGNPSRQEGKTK